MNHNPQLGYLGVPVNPVYYHGKIPGNCPTQHEVMNRSVGSFKLVDFPLAMYWTEGRHYWVCRCCGYRALVWPDGQPKEDWRFSRNWGLRVAAKARKVGAA